MTAIPQGRTRRRTVLAGAVCALVVTSTGLTGCGGEDPDAGTNGVGKLAADEIQAKAKAAAGAAGAVRLAGTVVAGGRSYKLDMRLKANGGSGTVTAQGASFQLLRIGEELYLKADAGFWKHEDSKDSEGGGGKDTDAADKLDGKYVKVPTGDPSYKKFSGFTDKALLLDSLLTLHGSLGKDGHQEDPASGARTIRISGGGGSGGTLDVALEGQPYPLRLVRAGDAGTLSFSAWGEDFALAEPAKDDTVDYGKELPTS
ncbi:hypothetical protein [Streptomyces sp. BK239]|uniref:hypothetical protein n=1 Tax=Streptomyces sp. BK239 TaxID=2512155 RepID=UPI00102C5878|nr:hypothetical protein [Streptomyces sp. BK239]RZU12860.1 hypothetical protein EV567_4965 [Streptomyces sp. BK239]